MPVELTLVESVTELETTVVEVILESSSTPGPAGPGVAAGGDEGQVLAKASDDDFDTEWVDMSGGPGGGAPTDATYLVTVAHDDLDAEVVVGATPGGELGGTWASPTVDATHSGSSHAGVQAAAEATAAGALAAHEADTTNIHGIANTAALALSANAVMDGDVAGGVLGGTYPNPSFASDMATQAELDAHISDSSAAHAASAVSADSTTLVGTGTDVQAVLEELDNGIADHLADTSAAHAATAISASSATLSGTGTDVQAVLEELDNLLDDHSSRHENGGADEISIAGLDGTPTELTNHLNDPSDAHDASAISFSPTGTVAATDVQAAIAEVASEASASMVEIFDSTLGSDQANFDITSIPGTYQALKIYLVARVSTGDAIEGLMRFNNDSAGNYAWYDTSGTGSGGATGDTEIRLGYFPGSSVTAGYAGISIVEIPFYAGTTFHKVCTSQGYLRYSGQQSDYVGGQWHSTAAITRVTLLPASGSWLTGSRCVVYGIV